MTEQRPLDGLRILVTRPRERAEAFARRLEALGAEPVVMPTIALVPPEDWNDVDRALQRLSDYDWVVFTSPAGVEFTVERLDALELSLDELATRQVAVIGPSTARALRSHGLASDFMPSRFIADAIVDELPDVEAQSFLLLRADIAREDLRHQLIERGAQVDEVTVYRTEHRSFRHQEMSQIFDDGIDVATFTSGSTARAFIGALGPQRSRLENVKLACIGPITANVVRDLGLEVNIVADVHTIDGLTDAIVREVMENARDHDEACV